MNTLLHQKLPVLLCACCSPTELKKGGNFKDLHIYSNAEVLMKGITCYETLSEDWL